MKETQFTPIVLKTIVVHTVTYFLVGLVAFAFLDYASKYADPMVAVLMRQTDEPLVASGPLFQIVRGFLFGLVLYWLRDIVFGRRYGWLILWLVLVIVGQLSPFGAAPGSIEGLIYTNLPLWFHLSGLPEIVIQALLFALLTCYWVKHPEKRWLSWALVIAFVAVVLLATMGVLGALGILPTPA